MLRLFRPQGTKNEAPPPSPRFREAPDVSASVHAEGLVLIDPATGVVFSANRVGALIWHAVNERWDLERMTDSISGEFEISADTARADAAAFLAQLEKAGLLVRDLN